MASWLAEDEHWTPARIGLVTTITGLGTLVLNGPMGVLVDRSGRPRLLLLLACAAILAGTLLILPARSFAGVLAAQFLAVAGGTLVVPTLTALTLGMVGKEAFPRQQGRNQAANHAGIVAAALLIGIAGQSLGPAAAFWVLGGMAAGALAAVAATPGRAWNGRRALGWHEDEPDEADHSHPVLTVLRDPRLLLLSGTLALFNLGNGSMLSLLVQRLAESGGDAARWTAIYVIVAQLTMIPVAFWAGSRADAKGRRHLLVLAFAALLARAVFLAFVRDPVWMALAEVLDGFASGSVGVAVPVLVADLTWGSGRTQTGLGVVNTLQGLGGALSGVFGGELVHWFGWTGTFLGLAVPIAVALGVLVWLEETRGRAMPYPPPRRRSEALPT